MREKTELTSAAVKTAGSNFLPETCARPRCHVLLTRPEREPRPPAAEQSELARGGLDPDSGLISTSCKQPAPQRLCSREEIPGRGAGSMQPPAHL